MALGLLFLSIGVFLIGSKDFRFRSTYILNTEFQNVGGLNNGAEVRVGGIHEGTVQQIRLPSQPNGKVTVVMKMDTNTKNILKRDSVASIKTEGLLGDKYVEVSFGSTKSPDIQNGDVIAGEVPKDIGEEARAVTDETKSAVEAFHSNMEALQQNFLLRGFFEKRGYNDPGELSEAAISHMPHEPPSRSFEYDATDLFDKPDNAKLKNKKHLDEIGKYLQENKFSLAIVAASTAVGDSQKDRVLTKARAKVVRDYLIQNYKLDDTRIKTIGLGKRNDMNELGKVSIFIYPEKREQNKE